MQSDHEYESAAEDSALDESEEIENDQIKAASSEQQPNGEATEAAVDNNDDGILDLSDKETEEPTEERGAGDGQEELKAKVDDDEDRRNPQYIPKKGMFYEHDDRIDSEDEAAEAEKTEENETKKKVPRSEATEKWGHDKFLEREQAPKSKEELVNIYGYDIRNEDNAPRARRRRRYGRGPNKYTRNWEDEKAYDSKPPPKENVTPSSRGRGRGRGGGHEAAGGPAAGRQKAVKSDDPEEFPPLENKESKVEAVAKPKTNAPTARGGRGGSQASNRGGGRSSNNVDNRKAKHQQNKSDASANQRLQKEPRPVEASKQQPHQPQRQEKAVEAKLDKEFTAKAKITDDNKGHKDSPRSKRKTEEGEHSRLPPQQPREQPREPKRYSNTRNSHNRNNNRQQQQPQQEYYNDMNGTNNYAAPPASTGHLPNSGPPPAAPFLPPQNVAATPTSTSGFLDPTAMVNYGPPPPVPGVQFTPVPVPVTVTVPLVTAAVPPTVHDTLPVLAPTNAEVLLAAAAGAAPQGYAEVRGGVTYFNPTAQPHLMARPVSKRPKAAIPIVDPSQVPVMSPQSSTEDELEQQPRMVASNT